MTEHEVSVHLNVGAVHHMAPNTQTFTEGKVCVANSPTGKNKKKKMVNPNTKTACRDFRCFCHFTIYTIMCIKGEWNSYVQRSSYNATNKTLIYTYRLS